MLKTAMYQLPHDSRVLCQTQRSTAPQHLVTEESGPRHHHKAKDIHAVIHFITIALRMLVIREAKLPPSQP